MDELKLNVSGGFTEQPNKVRMVASLYDLMLDKWITENWDSRIRAMEYVLDILHEQRELSLKSE